MRKRGTIYRRKRKKVRLPARSDHFRVFFPAAVVLILLTGLFFSSGKQVKSSVKPVNKSILAGLQSLIRTPTPTPSITPTPTVTPTPTPTPVPLPSRLIIDKLGVDAFIEFVTVDENNRMGVPEKWEDVAWYGPGPIPGTVGNSVIAGHLDTNTGAPAVFYRLGKLVEGDIIKVIRVDGRELDFQVTGKEVYPFDQFPVDYIFGPTDSSRLTLITCQGWWNRTIHSYSQRIAVFSDLL